MVTVAGLVSVKSRQQRTPIHCIIILTQYCYSSFPSPAVWRALATLETKSSKFPLQSFSACRWREGSWEALRRRQRIHSRALVSLLLLILSSHHFVFLLWILLVIINLHHPPWITVYYLLSSVFPSPSSWSREKTCLNSSKYSIWGQGEGRLSLRQCNIL